MGFGKVSTLSSQVTAPENKGEIAPKCGEPRSRRPSLGRWEQRGQGRRAKGSGRESGLGQDPGTGPNKEEENARKGKKRK